MIFSVFFPYFFSKNGVGLYEPVCVFSCYLFNRLDDSVSTVVEALYKR